MAELHTNVPTLNFGDCLGLGQREEFYKSFTNDPSVGLTFPQGKEDKPNIVRFYVMIQ